MSYRFICTKCGKPHWKQVTEIDTFSSCCDSPIKRLAKKYHARSDELAKKQLRILEKEYQYFFGKKTYG